jgi:hypothetical protein
VLIDPAEAKGLLNALEPDLIEAGKSATANWFSLVEASPGLARSLKPTTRANFIHDHLCREIDSRLADHDDFTATEALGFFAVSDGGTVLIRPKYVGRGVPHNVATAQQKLLARQQFNEEMIESLGFGPVTLLTCGYTLGDGELGRMEIRCDWKYLQSWSYDIYGGEATSAPVALPGLEDDIRPAAIKSTIKPVEEKDRGFAKEA